MKDLTKEEDLAKKERQKLYYDSNRVAASMLQRMALLSSIASQAQIQSLRDVVNKKPNELTQQDANTVAQIRSDIGWDEAVTKNASYLKKITDMNKSINDNKKTKYIRNALAGNDLTEIQVLNMKYSGSGFHLVSQGDRHTIDRLLAKMNPLRHAAQTYGPVPPQQTVFQPMPLQDWQWIEHTYRAKAQEMTLVQFLAKFLKNKKGAFTFMPLQAGQGKLRSKVYKPKEQKLSEERKIIHNGRLLQHKRSKPSPTK